MSKTYTKNSQSCRFYEHELPAVDDIVVISPTLVQDMGIYANLLEYNNIEGFMVRSEVTRRRIKSIKKYIKIGKQEFTVVLNINDKYIDLSKKRTTDSNIQQFKSKYKRHKSIHNVIKYIAEHYNINFESLLNATIWSINRHIDNETIQFNDVFSAFEAIAAKNTDILCLFELDKARAYNENEDMPSIDELNTILYNIIKQKYEPKMKTVRAVISLKCFKNGIDGIKRALNEGLKHSTEDLKIKINLITSPNYSIYIETTQLDKGIELINNTIESIKIKILCEYGEIEIIEQPRVINK